MTHAATADECPLPKQKPMLLAELFFGRAAVPDAAWQRFFAREVSPRFPYGSTALDARGEWRDPLSGHIARERSTVLIIAAPSAPETVARLAALADAYRRTFHQRSVGIVTTTECAAF